MKAVLFDLGNTLEKEGGLLPGATETLRAIQIMQDRSGQAPALALISDFIMPDSPDQISIIQQQYYEILDQLGIRGFFEPVSKMVTLSTEVGVSKPHKKIFEAALRKIDERLGLQDAVFITEDKIHITKARQLGMKAIHFKGPGQTTGDADRLLDLIPIVKKFIGTRT
jgi:FMN phosphatase YigB (HAD superfamily)